MFEYISLISLTELPQVEGKVAYLMIMNGLRKYPPEFNRPMAPVDNMDTLFSTDRPMRCKERDIEIVSWHGAGSCSPTRVRALLRPTSTIGWPTWDAFQSCWLEPRSCTRSRNRARVHDPYPCNPSIGS